MEEEIKNLSTILTEVFLELGLNEDFAVFINLAINILIIILLLFIIHFISRKVIVKTFRAYSNKSKTTFDDFLVQSNFPRYAGNILPLLLLIYTIPAVFQRYPDFLLVFEKLVDIYIIILTVLVCRSFLRSSVNFLKTRERYGDKPLESYTQVAMIFLWAIGFVFIFSELTDESVLNFLISLGAASAIILLIFKDTILGFVASIQVSVNDIVRIGDWITFSKYGADGYVTEINLATVRVQNWDKTFTTIPTYSLIGDSFQNWRGMQESPGRRVKRSLLIKQSSVKFLNEKELEKFKKFDLIKDYITERQKIIDDYNSTKNINTEVPVNGRKQTNLGLFRKYTDEYLRQHPLVSKELWIIVRHLDPTVHGIPLELYFFSSDKRWVYYEEVAADIFEHLIAALPYFGLLIFESPSGDDILKLSKLINPESTEKDI